MHSDSLHSNTQHTITSRAINSKPKQRRNRLSSREIQETLHEKLPAPYIDKCFECLEQSEKAAEFDKASRPRNLPKHGKSTRAGNSSTPFGHLLKEINCLRISGMGAKHQVLERFERNLLREIQEMNPDRYIWLSSESARCARERQVHKFMPTFRFRPNPPEAGEHGVVELRLRIPEFAKGWSLQTILDVGVHELD